MRLLEVKSNFYPKMSTSAEVKDNKQLNPAAVLLLVLPDICKYLNRFDLFSVFGVDKAWEIDVVRELQKRNYIQQLRLFYKCRNLKKLLQVEPRVSLLIYDDRLERAVPERKIPRLRKKILNHLEKRDLMRTIALKVTEYHITEDVDYAGPSDQDELKVTRNIHCGILGIFLPSFTRHLRTRIAWKPKIKLVEAAYYEADCIFNKLRLKDQKLNSAILVFVGPNEPGAAVVASILRDRINKEKTSIWVAEVGAKLAAVNYVNSNHRQNRKKCIAAVRIKAPTLSSWSETIDLRMSRDEVEQKLRELKERVVLKENCTALLSAPCRSNYGTSHEIMNTVRGIFQGISFVGLFDSHTKSIFPSKTEEMPFVVEDYAHMSLIIITY